MKYFYKEFDGNHCVFAGKNDGLFVRSLESKEVAESWASDMNTAMAIGWERGSQSSCKTNSIKINDVELAAVVVMLGGLTDVYSIERMKERIEWDKGEKIEGFLKEAIYSYENDNSFLYKIYEKLNKF